MDRLGRQLSIIVWWKKKVKVEWFQWNNRPIYICLCLSGGHRRIFRRVNRLFHIHQAPGSTKTISSVIFIFFFIQSFLFFKMIISSLNDSKVSRGMVNRSAINLANLTLYLLEQHQISEEIFPEFTRYLKIINKSLLTLLFKE
jgi:hypothetical protein